MNRRDFLKLGIFLGSAAALAGCGRPVDHALVSQYQMPEYRLPGVPRFYASSCGECRGGCGVAVRVLHGRANHVDGIPGHPMSRGASCALGQSALQALYHPDRLEAPLQGGRPVKWAQALKALAKQVEEGGAALWIVDRLQGSLGGLIAWLARRAGARLWVLEFPGTRAERAAMQRVGGRPELLYPDLENADYVVNFGDDPLGTGHSPVLANWMYGRFRMGSVSPSEGMPRRGLLVSFSSRMNLTAANSDRWVPVRPGGEGWAAVAVGNLLWERGYRGYWPSWARGYRLEECAEYAGVPAELLERLAHRLTRERRVLVLGGHNSACRVDGVAACEAIYALNALLQGGVPTFEPDLVLPVAEQEPAPADLLISARDAVRGLEGGQFRTVWALGTNPLYLLPAELKMGDLLNRASSRVAFSSFLDETAQRCDWVLPLATWMESWGDQRIDAPTGSLRNLQQPAVQPVGESRSLADILLEVGRAAGYQKDLPWKDARALLARDLEEKEWENALARGGWWPVQDRDGEGYRHAAAEPPPPLASPGEPAPGRSPWEGLQAESGEGLLRPAESAGAGALTLLPVRSPVMGDGTRSNRPWLQELPDPLTTVVWTSWLEVHPETARGLGVERGDLVYVSGPGGTIQVPVYVTPAIHPEAVAIPVGQGRTGSHHQFYGAGGNPLSIAAAVWQEGTGEVAWWSTAVSVQKVGRKARMTTYDTRVGALPRRVLPH